MKSDMTPMTSSTTPRSFTIVAAMRIGCRMMAMPIRLMTYRRAGRMASEFADGSVSGLLMAESRGKGPRTSTVGTVVDCPQRNLRRSTIDIVFAGYTRKCHERQ